MVNIEFKAFSVQLYSKSYGYMHGIIYITRNMNFSNISFQILEKERSIHAFIHAPGGKYILIDKSNLNVIQTRLKL